MANSFFLSLHIAVGSVFDVVTPCGTPHRALPLRLDVAWWHGGGIPSCNGPTCATCPLVFLPSGRMNGAANWQNCHLHSHSLAQILMFGDTWASPVLSISIAPSLSCGLNRPSFESHQLASWRTARQPSTGVLISWRLHCSKFLRCAENSCTFISWPRCRAERKLVVSAQNWCAYFVDVRTVVLNNGLLKLVSLQWVFGFPSKVFCCCQEKSERPLRWRYFCRLGSELENTERTPQIP